MRCLISLLLLVAACNPPMNGSQSPRDKGADTLSQTFLSEVMAQQLQDTGFILADKPFNFRSFGCLEPVLEDTATFTAAEIGDIKAQLADSGRLWAKEEFPGAKLVQTASIDSLFRGSGKGWNDFYARYGRSYHTLSRPVFLRRNTLCLFYRQSACGWLCAQGQLTLFRREKGQWKEIKVYCHWIS